MTNNQMRQYEIEQAKQRMGTYSGNASTAGAGMTNTVSTSGMGMTNTAGAYTNTTAQGKLKTSEKAQAREEMTNTNTMY